MGLRSAVESFREAIRARALRERGRARRLMRLGGRNQEVVAYDALVQANRRASHLYQAGQFWEDINADFRDLIWAGALENLRDEYFNVRFSGTKPESFQSYCIAVWLYYQKVRELDSLDILGTVPDPPIGGTRSLVEVSGRPMSFDFIQSVEEAYRIREAWAQSGRPGAPRVIVELGAGYGRLAYVCRRMFPECTYVILDLPEALMCASSWLGRVLPSEVVMNPSTPPATALSREALERQKVWPLEVSRIEELAAGSADVFANIYSFAEMPAPSIANYFTQVDRILSGVFYMKQRKVERNQKEGSEITEGAYPIPARWRKLYAQTASAYESVFEVAYAARS